MGDKILSTKYHPECETANGPSVQRTGLLFGSFNPVHFGHISIAEFFVKNNIIAEVWLVVTPQNPFKVNLELLDERERLKMVSMALEDKQNLVACDVEFNMPRPSYTIDTLLKLKQLYPQKHFGVILGSDQIERFKGWKEWQRIVSEFEVFFYPRPGTDDKCCNHEKMSEDLTLYTVNVKNADNLRLFNVSSTEIRNKLRHGLPVDGLLPDKVRNYIEEKKFYLNV